MNFSNKSKKLFEKTYMFNIYRQLYDRFYFSKKYPQKKVIFNIDNREIVFNTKTSYSKHFFFPRHLEGQLFEPPVTTHMINQMKRSSSFLDIGSCLGYYSILASKFLNGDNIQAFELDPFLAGEILKNAELNHANNIKVHNIGVGKTQEELFGVSTKSGYPLRFITPIKPNHKHLFKITHVPVKINSIDNLLEDEPIDLIKIDVEGAEFEVLLGMEKLISKYLPKLFIEIHPRGVKRFGYELNDILEYLWGKGYKIYEIQDITVVSNEVKIKVVDNLSNIKKVTMLYCEFDGFKHVYN